METLGIIVPVRSGSKRVLNKNTRPFAGNEGGLLEWKLKQLNKLSVTLRNQKRSMVLVEMIVSTDDLRCKEIAKEHGFKVHDRDPLLCTDQTTALQMINHAYHIMNADHIMWVHVTSPLVSVEEYANMITEYAVDRIRGTHDGLLSVLPFRNFMMDSAGKVINKVGNDPWPRTQDLEVWYEVTHSVFITSAKNHLVGSRYGFTPHLYNMPKSMCIDVDYPEDFSMAEQFVRFLYDKK